MTAARTPDFSAPIPIAERMPALTGLRGLTAAWVVAFHVAMLSAPPLPVTSGYARAFLEAGWSGVDIFFLLSGFTLMHAHGGLFARTPLAAARGFLIARFWRVYPLNTVVTALIGVYVLLDPGLTAAMHEHSAGSLSSEALWRTLTLSTRWFGGMHGEWNEPTWSLSAEIIGYAAFPLIAYLAMRTERCGQALSAAALSYLALLNVQAYYDLLGNNAINGVPSVARMMGEFVAGALLHRARATTSPGAAHWAGATGALSAILLLVCAASGRLAFLPLAAAGMVWSLSFPSRSMLTTVCEARPVMFLGRISFPLYLLHVMTLRWILHIAERWRIASPVAYAGLIVLAIAVIVIASWLLHRAVELPSARRARRFLSSPPDATTAALQSGTAVA